MREYFKNFKEFIPTWVICIFMFVGVFGWTFIIGLILLIIQCFQLNKIKKSHGTTVIKDAKNSKIILTAGRYVGGRDIPCGIYNIKILSGNGTVNTEDINKEYANSANIRLCLQGRTYNGLSTYPPSYNGLEIRSSTILKINETAKIKFTFSKEISNEITDEKLELTEENYEENESQDNNEFLEFDYDLMNGWQFEEFCAKVLENNGFSETTVTSGSGDFGADIIAYKNEKKYVIQCKNYSSKVGNKAVQEIFSAKAYYKADFAAVMTNNYFTEHAIEHAKGTDVILWNRDCLDRMISNIKLKNSKDYKELEQKSQSEAKDILYDKEKGIYPSGRYIIGEDIDIGSYAFISRENEEGEIYLYKTPNSKEYVLEEYFEGAYYISLKEKGNLLIIKNAHIQKI